MKMHILRFVIFLLLWIVVLVIFYTVLLKLIYSFSWKKVVELGREISSLTVNSTNTDTSLVPYSKDYNLNKYTQIDLIDHQCDLLASYWNPMINGLAPDPRTYRNRSVCWFYSDNRNDNNQTNRILYFDPLQYNLQKLLSVDGNIVFHGKGIEIVGKITSILSADFETVDGIIRKDMSAKFIIIEINKEEQILNKKGIYRIGFVN